MRVIAGKARGRKLKMVPGDTTRPVRDIVKESLFNILGDWVRDSRWLDVFAGTGAIGIEALSRGAEYCLFLDSARAAVETIHDNLKSTQCQEGGEVRRTDSFSFLSNDPTPETMFDVIYVAPPQYKGLWRRTLELIDERPGWLYDEGIVIVQIDPVEDEEVPLENLVRYDERKYGSTLLCFYELLEDDHDVED